MVSRTAITIGWQAPVRLAQEAPWLVAQALIALPPCCIQRGKPETKVLAATYTPGLPMVFESTSRKVKSSVQTLSKENRSLRDENCLGDKGAPSWERGADL